jgi:mycofactocin precursor
MTPTPFRVFGADRVRRVGVLATWHSDPRSSVRRVTHETDPQAPAEPGDTDELIEDELIIEEISIDGMCGVY